MLRGTGFFRGRVGFLVIALALTLPLVGCGDDTTEIIQLVDCGLVRLDLIGTWSVEFVQDPTTNVFNCGTPANDGFWPLTVEALPTDFFHPADYSVFSSAGNVGFQIIDLSIPPDLIANIEADSCLMSLSFLDPDDSMYINCFGTFDIPTGIMLGGCDSASLVDMSGTIIDDCDLVDVLGVTASVI